MSKNRYEIKVWASSFYAEKALALKVYLNDYGFKCGAWLEGQHVVFGCAAWTSERKAYKAALSLEAAMWNEVYSGEKQKGTLAGYWAGTPEVRKVAK